MITILMKYHGHSLQSAVDEVADRCAKTIEEFERQRALVPSWGPEVDDMVTQYIQGLQDWIVGYVCSTLVSGCINSQTLVIQIPPLEFHDGTIFRKRRREDQEI
jgi:hypothetical protein